MRYTNPRTHSLSHTRAHTHARTHTHTTVYPGRPVPEETLTHSHPSWSSDILYHLSPFTTIHGILFVHFKCLTILSDNLSPGPLWSFVLVLELHTPYISSPNHHLFAAHAHTNAACSAAKPMLCHLYLYSLSLSSLLGYLSFSLTPHIHLTTVISAR